MKIRTIDINAKEWFDKLNGNSYFAGTVTINYGMKSEKSFILPFQYGYSDCYIDEGKKLLTEFNYISTQYAQPLWRYCKDKNIILRTSKQENCLKRDLNRI